MALLTLDEAKAQLNVSSTADDVELQAYVDSVTAVIEGIVGPVEQRTVTETANARGTLLCLQQIPAVSITSLTPVLSGGTAVAAADVVLDGASGVVRKLDGGTFSGGPWTVTYTAGRASTPPTINLAARIMLQHLWRTQYGSSRVLGGGSDDYSVSEPAPGFGFAVPNRVLQLLQPYKTPPAVA